MEKITKEMAQAICDRDWHQNYGESVMLPVKSGTMDGLRVWINPYDITVFAAQIGLKKFKVTFNHTVNVDAADEEDARKIALYEFLSPVLHTADISEVVEVVDPQPLATRPVR